jgi:predicted outer membrane repeat protein
MLCNDYNHSASHSGGAIFGSKKLKAVVVYGTKRPPLHDKAALIEAGLRWRKTLQVYSVQDRTGVGHARHLDALPNNNMQSSLIADHNRGFDQNGSSSDPAFSAPVRP